MINLRLFFWETQIFHSLRVEFLENLFCCEFRNVLLLFLLILLLFNIQSEPQQMLFPSKELKIAAPLGRTIKCPAILQRKKEFLNSGVLRGHIEILMAGKEGTERIAAVTQSATSIPMDSGPLFDWRMSIMLTVCSFFPPFFTLWTTKCHNAISTLLPVQRGSWTGGWSAKYSSGIPIELHYRNNNSKNRNKIPSESWVKSDDGEEVRETEKTSPIHSHPLLPLIH